jgi:signal peptidase
MKSLGKIWSIASGIITALIVIMAILLAGVRIVGMQPFAVLSGSMEPEYHVGSMIYVKSCVPDDVEVGDAITFALDDNVNVVTHRVIKIDSGSQCFYTKGDANDSPDGSPVSFENLIGRPVFTIPYLGYISNWITNPPGMYAAISIAGIILILLFLPNALRKADEADRRAAEKKQQGL